MKEKAEDDEESANESSADEVVFDTRPGEPCLIDALPGKKSA